MTDISRRSAIALGLTAAATPLIAGATPAAAKTYGADEGKEIYPGVRLIVLGNRAATIPAYKTVEVVDVVFQPGSKAPLGEPMESDMVCHVPVGELRVTQGGDEFAVKEGGVWSCHKGSTREGATNAGSGVAVMRIIMLKA